MWFNLIQQRIENDYYRSQKQLLADIDLVMTNAEFYNGKDHEIAVDAKEVTQRMKGELVKCIDKLGDSHLKQRVADATSMFASS